MYALHLPAEMSLIDTPVAVPDDFLGLHMWSIYPEHASFVLPKFGYSTIRTHDVIRGWCSVNPSQGVFDWAHADNLFALGKSMWWQVHGTPTWAASVEDRAYLGPYEVAGSGGVPTDMAYLAEYVTEVCNRYKSTGRLKRIGIWNEPVWGSNGFRGTAADLVMMGETIRAAAKAVIPEIKVVSPSFGGAGISYITDWLSAQDPVSGKYGHQIIDEFAYHPYLWGPSPMVNKDFFCGSYRTSALRAALDAVGRTDCKIIADEWGWGDSNIISRLPVRANQMAWQWTVDKRRRQMLRILANHACAGYTGSFVFMYGTQYSGDLLNDQAYISALDEFQDTVPGKTITEAYQNADQSISLVVDGASVVW